MLRRSLDVAGYQKQVGLWDVRVWTCLESGLLKIQQRVRERETDAVQSIIELEPPAKCKLHNLKIFAILCKV